MYSPQLTRLLIKSVLVYCAYLSTAWLGLSVPFVGDKVTLFWLPSGISVAAIYRWGWRIVPAIFLAAFTINASKGADVLTGVLIAAGNSLGPWAAAYLLKLWQCDLVRLNQYTALKTIAAAIVGALVSAVIGTGALSLGQGFDSDKTMLSLLAWWMGDSLGIVLCAPLLINLSRALIRDVLKQPFTLITFLAMGLIIGLLCFPLNQFNNSAALPIAFVTFVCVAWAALSLGLVGAAFSSMGFSFIAIWATTEQLGPFVFPNIQLSFWAVWVYTITMTLLGMMITSAHSEIIETTQRLMRANGEQLQHQEELQQFNNALSIAASDARDTQDFIASLLKSLGQVLGADHLMVSLVDDTKTHALTHTYWSDGEIKPNFSYALQHTPCDDVIDKSFCFIPERVQQLYPEDTMLVEAGIESYLGVVVQNLQGSSIGILIALGRQKITPKPQVHSLMKIYSERIAGEIRRAEDQEKIFNLAFYDPLTLLPNRRLLQERLKLLKAQSVRTGQYGAILFIDIDHFKFLNDTLGHHIGDLLLTRVAQRINSIIRSTDLAARLGGDEFVVVFDNLGVAGELAALEAKKRAEELHTLISQPYPLQNTLHHCTISIGVNIFVGNQRSMDDLLRHADLAMYEAKDSGRNAIRFFDPTMQLQMELRSSIEHDLRTALELDTQLIPYYQIQTNADGKAIGAELLIRWRHPERGLISPADFIPIAEQAGLISRLGYKVVQMACHQLTQWRDKPMFNGLKIAVNVSPIQLNQNNFVPEALALIERYAVDAKLLTMELTEGSLMNNIDACIAKMLALQDKNIGFSMDDFGVGYSSLSSLKRFPLHQLKIDQSFIRDISTDPNDRVIVRTIIAMAQNLELDVLAEGVETLEQKNYLIEHGCNKFQGYYFGRPVPIEEFELQRLQFG
ncbi:MAG: hypothetical protein RL497_2569 [Pseudomonadota bacterium]|jgi:diguanylate cyclase (GGDEF)-like protein